MRTPKLQKNVSRNMMTTSLTASAFVLKKRWRTDPDLLTKSVDLIPVNNNVQGNF